MDTPKNQLPALLDIPPKLIPIIKGFNDYQYFLIEGGRGSGKSHSVARFMCYLGHIIQDLRVFFGREIQNTIEESVYALLKDLIRDNHLAFEVGATKIDHANNGTMFRFKGFREQGAVNIKGLEGVDILVIEEAQQIKKDTLDIILPTIRKPNSKIFFIMNRLLKDDPVYVAMAGRKDCLHIHIDYFENPYCPEKLINEANECKARNIEDYNHIWLGQPRDSASNAAFRNVDHIVNRTLAIEIAPMEGVPYTMGLDLAKSIDYTVITVIDNRYKRQVYWERMENENRSSWHYQKTKALAVSKKYNNALIVPDASGVGDPIVEDLVRMGGNVYHQQKEDSDKTTPGIKFTSVNKENLIEKLKVAIETRLIEIPFIKQQYDELVDYRAILMPSGNTRYSCPDELDASGNKKHDDCFVKGTMILTDKGQVPIEQITVGDRVMTRQGYRPVIRTRNKYKNVITNIGLTGTPDHPIITPTGIKELAKVKEIDTIYIWNEKLSSIEEKSITDIRNQNADSCGFIIGDTTNGKNLRSHYIVNCGLTILEQFQKVQLFITKTLIPSIMRLTIWSAYPQANILQCTCLPQKENYNPQSMAENKLMRSWQVEESGVKRNHPKSSCVKTHTEASITQSQEKQCAYFAKRNSRIPLRLAVDSVVNFAMLVIAGKRKVYNLQVLHTPEYFANNILVHNCVISLSLALWGTMDAMYAPEYQAPNHETQTDRFWNRIKTEIKNNTNNLQDGENDITITDEDTIVITED